MHCIFDGLYRCLLFYVYQIIKISHCVNSNQTITTATESEQNTALYILVISRRDNIRLLTGTSVLVTIAAVTV